MINQTVDLALLDPHPRNYKRHPKTQIERLRKSLRSFGQPRSIVVQDRANGRFLIVAGHGVVMAAQAEGWTTIRADVIPADWEPERVAAYLAADNELSRLGENDNDALADILEEASAYDAELLGAIGYDEAEFQALLAEAGRAVAPPVEDPGAQTSRADELLAKWKVEPGDLWQLGDHRLICGECTDAATVARVMGGEKADCIFTDPPYNCASENDIYGADVSKAMKGLKSAEWDKNFDLQPALALLPMADDVSVYVCSSHHLSPVIWDWMKTWADHYSWCVWSKPNPMPSLSKRHWTWNAELIPYATRGKHTFNFPIDGHALCVWAINKHKETEHPTEKPVEVPAHAISHSSKAGDIVFDGFSGSGTTIIACEQLGRRCRAVEIAPAYCAVALERWSVATGREPVRLP